VPIRHSSFADCLEKHLVVRLAASAVHRAASGTGSLASIAPELSRDPVERVWVARSSQEGRGSWWCRFGGGVESEQVHQNGRLCSSRERMVRLRSNQTSLLQRRSRVPRFDRFGL
jgi:hypothetical protein